MTHEHDERPTVEQLRQGHLLGGQLRIGTGWPVIDELTRGLPVRRTTVVRGPADQRLQVLARMAAWAAGEGHPTVLASSSVSTRDLWLAIGAGGLGLPPRALLTTDAHDAWVDDRLRVLDVRVFGGGDAPDDTAEALRARPATVVIVDDYKEWESQWDRALDPRFERLHVRQWPSETGCALVLGVTSMEDFSDWIFDGVFTVRLAPSNDGRSITISLYDGALSDRRTMPLQDGFLPPPPPGATLVRRPGVQNLWNDRSEEEISRFATALGGEVVQQEVETEHDLRPRPEGQ